MRYYVNGADEVSLSNDYSSTATTIAVSDASSFPQSYPYTIVLDPDTPGSMEVVTVTDANGNTLTVKRGQDNTTAIAHAANTKVRHEHSARDFQESQNHQASASVHSVGSGSRVVGTKTVQALQNKDLTDGSNKFPETLWPVGELLTFAISPNDPTLLWCNGTTVLRSAYPKLNAKLAAESYPWGDGDGSTTFNLPDLRNRYLMGSGPGNTLGSTDGSAVEDRLDLTEHTHQHANGTLATDSAGAHTHNAGTLETYGPRDGVSTAPGGDDAGGANHTHDVTGSTGSAGQHYHNVHGNTSYASLSHPQGSVGVYIRAY